MYLANFDTNVFKERLKDIFARRRVSIENTVEEATQNNYWINWSYT
nr:hypothetical protein [Mycoplasmopsis bovis]